jgi:hypothetical protein
LGDKTGGLHRSPLQDEIPEVLGETGAIEPGDPARLLGITPMELDREVAALRHMEKVRRELGDS